SGGVQVELSQLCLRHVAVRGYELVYAPCNSAPRQVYVLAAALFQSDAFGVVPFVAPRRSCERVTVPAGAVKVFEHSGLLTPGVFLGEILENAPFAAHGPASVRQCISYLVLRYEAVYL